jgi:hypothetical protein
MNKAAKIITSNGITLYYNGGVFMVSKDHAAYNDMLSSLKHNDYEKFIKLYSKTNPMECLIEDNSIVSDNTGSYYVKNNKRIFLGDILSQRYNDLLEGGYDVSYLRKFIENLVQNTSYNAIKSLYGFLEDNDIPITDDGHFLAYKVVDKNYQSKTKIKNLNLVSGRYNDNQSIHNGIGEIIECLRSDVDDDSGTPCSSGFHAGGLKYSGPGGTYYSSGDKVIIVKINPRDVVSVPEGHTYKLRTCKYEVIKDYTDVLPTIATDECYSESSNNDSPKFFTKYNKCHYVGELITFKYRGKTRHGIIKDIESDKKRVLIQLTSQDTGFIDGDKNLRSFIVEKMQELANYYKIINKT